MIQIIDNVVSSRYQTDIEETFLSPSFYWNFNPKISGYINANHSGLTHQIVDSGVPSSNKLDYILPLVFEIADKSNSNVAKVQSGRAFMQLAKKDFVDIHDTFHIDILIPHIVFLYYINDSDGDTIILDKKYDNENNFLSGNLNDYSVLERVTPKKGRAVIFDGYHYHAAGLPKNRNRAVLNFNMI